ADGERVLQPLDPRAEQPLDLLLEHYAIPLLRLGVCGPDQRRPDSDHPPRAAPAPRPRAAERRAGPGLLRDPAEGGARPLVIAGGCTSTAFLRTCPWQARSEFRPTPPRRLWGPTRRPSARAISSSSPGRRGAIRRLASSKTDWSRRPAACWRTSTPS